jgi:hypothetical protein
MMSMFQLLDEPLTSCNGSVPVAYGMSGSNGDGIVHPPINNSKVEIPAMLDYQGSIRLYRVGRGGNRDRKMEEISTEVAPPRDGGSNATVAGWSKPCPDNSAKTCRIDFSSLCYFFGRDLFEMLEPKRPIGLIGSYVGGTPDEAWTGEDALKKCLDPHSPRPPQQTNYSALWNSMIAPLTNTTIKGAVW